MTREEFDKMLTVVDHREHQYKCLSCFDRGYWFVIETGQQLPCPHCNAHQADDFEHFARGDKAYE